MSALASQVLTILAAVAGIGTGAYFICRFLMARHRRKEKRERAVLAKLETIEKTLEDKK